MPVKIKRNNQVLYIAPDMTQAIVWAFDNGLTTRLDLDRKTRRYYNQSRGSQKVQYLPGVSFEEEPQNEVF